jgi:hypothetical protein
MIKLKDLLNEIAWKDSTLMLSAQRKIPISAPIMKKVIGDIDVSSFHITDIKNVGKLKSLVGKKKSISTFNAYGAEASELKHGIGIQTKGGILVSVEGKLLASSVSDIMSQPDEAGRRWVADYTFGKMFGNTLDSGAIESELGKNKIWKEKYSNLSIEQIKSLTNKEKAEYIKIYIDTLTKMMIKNKDIIKKVFELSILRSDVYWNEIILSQIKVKDALIFSDSVPMKFVWDKHPEHNTIDTYGIKFLSKNQIMGIVKKVTTGKVIWGKLSDMVKFIKKRGGNPYEPKFKIGIVK